MKSNLQETFGNIDIYLFDQILKGRFDNCQTVLDVGCGAGRNLVYFLQQNFNVFGIDADPQAISKVQAQAQQLAPLIPPDNFKIAFADALPYSADTFDLIICSAMLHFARNRAHFELMLNDMWRVLKPGGYFFARLASSIGLEHLVQNVGQGRYHLPDGSVRFLVDEDMLLHYTKLLNGQLFEYIKTTNVQNLRCMTTWCLQKNHH